MRLGFCISFHSKGEVKKRSIPDLPPPTRVEHPEFDIPHSQLKTRACHGSSPSFCCLKALSQSINWQRSEDLQQAPKTPASPQAYADLSKALRAWLVLKGRSKHPYVAFVSASTLPSHTSPSRGRNAARAELCAPAATDSYLPARFRRPLVAPAWLCIDAIPGTGLDQICQVVVQSHLRSSSVGASRLSHLADPAWRTLPSCGAWRDAPARRLKSFLRLDQSVS